MTSLGSAILSVVLQAGSFTSGLQTVRNNSRTALTALEAQAQATANQVGTAFQDGLAQSNQLVNDLATSIGSAFGVLQNPVAAATMAVTAFTAAAAVSVDKAADFEQQMSAVEAVAGATGDQMKSLSDLALDMGAKTSFSAMSAAQGIEELAKAGVSTTNIIGGGLEGALSLAAASGMKDLASASEIASNALNTFSLTGKDMGMVADVIANTANTSALGVEDWAQSLSAAGPVVAQAGIKVDEFSAIMGLMANNALKGSDAGTSLKTMLMALQAPSDQAGKTLKALGINIYDANGKMMPFTKIAKDLPTIMKTLENSFEGLSEKQRNEAASSIFGADGIRAFNILMKEGAGKLSEMTQALGKQGAAAETAEKRLDNYRGATEQMSGAAETLAINFGSMLLPSLTAIVKEVTVWINILNNAVSWLKHLTDSIREAVKPMIDSIQSHKLFGAAIDAVKVSVALLAGGAGLVMLRTGFIALATAIRAAVMPTITALIAALGPVIVPIAAISAAVGALYLAWRTNFLGLKDFTDKVVEQVKVILARFPIYFKAVQETLKIMGGVFKDVFQGISKIVGGLDKIFTALVVKPAAKMAKDMSKVLVNVGETVQSWVNGLFEMIKPLVDFFKSIGVGIADFATNLATGALDALKKRAGEAADAVGEIAAEAKKNDKTGEVAKGLAEIAAGYEQIKGSGKGAGTEIAEAWQKAIVEANKITPATMAAAKAQEEARAQAEMAADAARKLAEEAGKPVTKFVELGKEAKTAAKVTTEAVQKLIPSARLLVQALKDAEKVGNEQAITRATLKIDAFKRANTAGAEAISIVTSSMQKANQVAEQNARAQEQAESRTRDLSKAMRDMQREWASEIKNKTLTLEKAQDYAYALIDVRDAMMKLPPALQSQLRAQYDQLYAMNLASEGNLKAIASYKLLKEQVEPVREKLKELAESWKEDINNKNLSIQRNKEYESQLGKLNAQIAKMPAAARAMLTADIALMNQINRAGDALSTAIDLQDKYEKSIVKLTKAVKDWSREELEAAKTRVIASGGDPKKIAILQERLDELNAAQQESQATRASIAVSTAKDETDALVAEYDRRMASVKDNLGAQYLIEMTLGAQVLASRKKLRELERIADVEALNKKFDELAAKNKGNADEVTRIEADRITAITALNANAQQQTIDMETAHTNSLTELFNDRETALKDLTVDARKQIREQTLSLYKRALTDAEKSRDDQFQVIDNQVRNEEITALEGANRKLKITKDFEGILRRNQIDFFEERKRLEEEDEKGRYAALVVDLKKRGLYTRDVEQDQLRIHLNKMNEILGNYNSERSTELRKLETSLSVAQDEVRKEQLAAAKKVAEELANVSSELTEAQLKDLADMSGAMRKDAANELQQWAIKATGAKNFEDAIKELAKTAPVAAANISKALKKIFDADKDAGKSFTDASKDLDIKNFQPDLAKLTKPDSSAEVAAAEVAKYAGLIQKVEDEKAKLVTAFNNLSPVEQDAQRANYDVLIKNADTFISTTRAKGAEAGKAASDAYVQGQKDAGEKARLELSKTQLEVGIIKPEAYKKSLEDNKTYWESRVATMVAANVTGTELVNAQIELEKAKRNSLNFTIDQQIDKLKELKQVSDTAEKGYGQGRVTQIDYKKALQEDLNYNKSVSQNAQMTGEQRAAALERIYEIELKIKNLELTNKTAILQRATEVLDYASQAATAASGLASALGNDDAAANLNGMAKAFNFVKDSATDVMKIMANPADIGSWVRLGTRIVSTITDAINGFKKAKEEVKKLGDEFNSQFSIIDGSKLAEFSTRSRGFFADVFGGGPEVVKKINETAAAFAKTLESGVKSALTNSVKAFLTVSDAELKKLNMTAQEYATKSLRGGIKDAILTAVVDAVIQAAVIKGKLGSLLTDLSTALGAGDMGLASNLIKSIGQAIPGVMAALTPVLNQVRDTMTSAFPEDQSIGMDVNTDTSGLSIPAEIDMPASVQVIAQTPLTERFDRLGAILERQITALNNLTATLARIEQSGFKHEVVASQPSKLPSSVSEIISAMRYSRS